MPPTSSAKNSRCSILFIIVIFTALLPVLPTPVLAQAEQARSVIMVGSEIDFPPYAIVDAKGRASGFSVELLEAVADVMGLSIKVNTRPWPELLAAFKAGEYDLLPLVALSAKRAEMATFTKPHTLAYDSFFVRKGSRPISSLAEAKGREVIVMSNDAAHEALINSGLPVRIVETKNIPEAMRLLASGKHDAVLVPKLLGLLILRETKLEGVIKAGPPIPDYNRQFAFAVQRGNTELRDKLEQGIAIVRTTGKYDKIYNKWFGGIEEKERFPWYLLGLVVGSSILAALFALGWVLSYRRQKALQESEERFRALHDASFGGIIIHDNGLILDCNQGLSDMTGFTNEELIGMDGLKLIDPDSLDLVIQNIQSGFDQRYEVVGVRKDGTKYPLSIKGKNIPYQGSTARVIEFSDISERKQAEEALQKAHDELGILVSERTRELAATVETLRNEIAERERMAVNLLRYNRLYAVLSTTNRAIVHASDRDSLFRELCRIAVEQGGFLLSWVGVLDEESSLVSSVAACGATGFLEDIRISVNEGPFGVGPTGIAIRAGTYYICNDFLNAPCTQPWHEKGRNYGIRASASVALKEEGRVIGALTMYAEEKDFFDREREELLVQMGEDVSFALDNMAREESRKKAEQSLHEETLGRLRAIEELREKEQMLVRQNSLAAMGEMISNIAHQWRNPLNNVALIIQNIQGEYDSGTLTCEEMHSDIHDALEVLMQMSQTIDDFRNFFRPDKEKRGFLISEAVDRALTLVSATLKSCNIQVEIITDDEVTATGFQNEYSQVLLNIISNTCDACIERSVADPRIFIRITRENERSVLYIRDNCGGIPDDVILKIFEPYFTTRGPDKGTGIGLYMSKMIIEQNMGGHLTASNVAGGAEFRIEV